ncbi:MAG: hypothetical protein K2L41_02240 [Muribaculaceae bacterium]|nr:hypothetical protein [Muribaculaceae bacterium]
MDRSNTGMTVHPAPITVNLLMKKKKGSAPLFTYVATGGSLPYIYH